MFFIGTECHTLLRNQRWSAFWITLYISLLRLDQAWHTAEMDSAYQHSLEKSIGQL